MAKFDCDVITENDDIMILFFLYDYFKELSNCCFC